MYKPKLQLNESQIHLLRSSWNQMILDDISSNVSSSLFCRQIYANLLSMQPGLEKHFPSIKHQAVAFAGVMSFAISHLEKISVLDDYLLNLGKRHSRILVIEPFHFELMGIALIKTFNERFGGLFTTELENLWLLLYLYLSNSLLQFGIDPVLKLSNNIFITNVIETFDSVIDYNDVQTIQDKEDVESNSSNLSLVNDQNRSSISTLNTVISKFNKPNVPEKKPQEKPILENNNNNIQIQREKSLPKLEKSDTKEKVEKENVNDKFDLKKINKKLRKRDNCVIM